jgi:hypothetical protein
VARRGPPPPLGRGVPAALRAPARVMAGPACACGHRVATGCTAPLGPSPALAPGAPACGGGGHLERASRLPRARPWRGIGSGLAGERGVPCEGEPRRGTPGHGSARPWRAARRAGEPPVARADRGPGAGVPPRPPLRRVASLGPAPPRVADGGSPRGAHVRAPRLPVVQRPALEARGHVAAETPGRRALVRLHDAADVPPPRGAPRRRGLEAPRAGVVAEVWCETGHSSGPGRAARLLRRAGEAPLLPARLDQRGARGFQAVRGGSREPAIVGQAAAVARGADLRVPVPAVARPRRP